MEQRQLGRTDMKVSVLGFGGSEIGMQGASTNTVRQLLNTALDAGLNVIDTAECYGNSEEMIGEAISHRRQEFYLFTKVGHPNGMPMQDWRPESIQQSIERSLHRMKTDRLDLVQLHSCSEAELHNGEAIEALKKARDKGHTRYIGYSGDGLAAKYAIECGEFDTLQTSVNIADQECIELTLPLAAKRQMGVIAKRPIANAAWKTGQQPENSYHWTYWNRLQQLGYDFLDTDLAESIGIALRFTLAASGVHTAIVGTTRPGRWQENAKLLEAGDLPQVEFDKIRKRWHEVASPNWTGQQ
ncbi:MAG: aldo/keto reductase [Gemmataceae bacterium]